MTLSFLDPERTGIRPVTCVAFVGEAAVRSSFEMYIVVTWTAKPHGRRKDRQPCISTVDELRRNGSGSSTEPAGPLEDPWNLG